MAKLDIMKFKTWFSVDRVDNKTSKDKESMTARTPPVQPIAAATLQLYREENRLATFNSWPLSYIQPAKLAQLGFYYIGPSDMVKCFFCRVEIGMWENGDDVLTDHMRWSSSCPLIRRRDTTNIPLDAEELNRVLPPRSVDTCGPHVRQNVVLEGNIGLDDVHMHQHYMFNQGGLSQVMESTPQAPMEGQKKPEHPEFALETQRLNSYEDWPKTMKQKSQELSDAGFFYTGKGDKVACFSCGGGLKDWEERDVPWEQHAMWYSTCEYLKLMKGMEYVNAQLRIRAAEEKKHQNSNQNSEPGCSGENAAAQSSEIVTCDVPMEEEEEKPLVSESKLCKICYVTEYNTAFFPCGHVIACAKCASSVTKCPCCRQPFTSVMRVYFS